MSGVIIEDHAIKWSIPNREFDSDKPFAKEQIMNADTTHGGGTVRGGVGGICPEFIWAGAGGVGFNKAIADEVAVEFTGLLNTITAKIPAKNAYYLGLVKANLEQAYMYALKGFTVNQ